jgi:hypothetical protein
MPHNSSLCNNTGYTPSHGPSTAQRKRDLLALAEFGHRTGRQGLLDAAFDTLAREGLGEPAYLAEAKRPYERWIVAEPLDALRLETYGLPALATEPLTALTLRHVDCPWVILLERPGEQESMAGLDVRAELLSLGWSGTLTTVHLPFESLETAEAECLPHSLPTFLVSLLTHAHTQELRGEERSAPPAATQRRPEPRPYTGYRGYQPYRAYGLEVSCG